MDATEGQTLEAWRNTRVVGDLVWSRMHACYVLFERYLGGGYCCCRDRDTGRLLPVQVAVDKMDRRGRDW